jgi:hypothetical protein
MLTQEDLDSALQLPAVDRLLIASRLLETLPDELAAAGMDEEEFTAELERRSGDWRGAVSWEELKASMQSDQ